MLMKKYYLYIIEWFLIVLFAVAVVGYSNATIPLHMDEFSQYNVLARLCYPMSSYNIFQELSTVYDLALFGQKFLPLRSYAYVGSFPCLYYYPLFKLWPSPYGVRVIGMLFLIIQAWCCGRFFKTRIIWPFIFLVGYMPYAFQHLVDTGVIAFHTTSVFVLCVIVRQWGIAVKESRRYAWQYPLYAAIIIFLGIWVKLAYFFMLPGIAIVMGCIFLMAVNNGEGWRVQQHLRQIGAHVLLLISIVGSLTALLLNASMRNGQEYYHISNTLEYPKPVVPTSDHIFLRLGEFFTNPLLTVHRVFDVGGRVSVEGVLLLAVFVFLLCVGIMAWRKQTMSIMFSVIALLGALIIFGWVSSMPSAWAMHHVVLCMPFLLLGLGDVAIHLSVRRVVKILLVIFLLINAALYYQLHKLTFYDHACPSKARFNDVINEEFAGEYVCVVIDWGMYFEKALYGPHNQCVLYIKPFHNVMQVAVLKKILHETQRKVLFIGRTDSDSDLGMMRAFFPDVVEYKAGFDTGKWRVWYQP